MKISVLERDVLKWFGTRSGNEAIAAQCELAIVMERKRTGPGLITTLHVPDAVPRAPFGCTPNAPLISSPVLPHGAGVDLWLEDGRICELEFVTFGGVSFPDDDFEYALVESL